MTIWFSTNIPEMRAISTFNKVSTDIGDIQQRITTGQRINSGKDDPGGLIIREGLRADIKNIQALQSGMAQAENLTNVASGGMMQLLEILRGPDTDDSTNSGLLGELYSSTDHAQTKAAAQKFMQLYDAAITTTRYNGQSLLAGDMKDGKTFQLGGGETLTISIDDLSTDSTTGAANNLNEAITNIDAGVDGSLEAAIASAENLLTIISKAAGTLGSDQKVVAQNQRLLNSRLTSVTAAEGRISNADIAVESSRMARAELLAQNAMSSIMYTRSYAAFAVSSLFR